MFGLTSNHAATGTASILIDTPVDQVFSFIAVDFLKIIQDGRPKYKN